jgi:hypothetical protein
MRTFDTLGEVCADTGSVECARNARVPSRNGERGSESIANVLGARDRRCPQAARRLNGLSPRIVATPPEGRHTPRLGRARSPSRCARTGVEASSRKCSREASFRALAESLLEHSRARAAPAKAHITKRHGCRATGGEGGIRTLGTLADTHDFQSCTFGHSVTSPLGCLAGRHPTRWKAHRELILQPPPLAPATLASQPQPHAQLVENV